MGVAEFAAALTGRVSVVTGPSGPGKSSLLNAVQPGLQLRTGELSAKVGRGKNTTVSAMMIPLAGGGFLVDTPGFSDVGLWAIDPKELASAFRSFVRISASAATPTAGTHRAGCRITAAVGRGGDRGGPAGELPGARWRRAELEGEREGSGSVA